MSQAVGSKRNQSIRNEKGGWKDERISSERNRRVLRQSQERKTLALMRLNNTGSSRKLGWHDLVSGKKSCRQ